MIEIVIGLVLALLLLAVAARRWFPVTAREPHDPLCRQKHWTGGDCFDCRLIARVVKREREERERDWAEAYARVDAEARADERERLRAQAMNLTSRVELGEVGNEVTWVRYADVTALLGGQS